MNDNGMVYIVAYKQHVNPTALWHRYRFGLPWGISSQVADELVLSANNGECPYIQRVAIFDLETWDFGRAKGKPAWEWARPAEVVIETENVFQYNGGEA